jgi:hypothetical protein
MHHQTWFLPNDQAFASIGSSLSFLLDQSSMNSTNDINEVKIFASFLMKDLSYFSLSKHMLFH